MHVMHACHACMSCISCMHVMHACQQVKKKERKKLSPEARNKKEISSKSLIDVKKTPKKKSATKYPRRN